VNDLVLNNTVAMRNQYPLTEFNEFEVIPFGFGKISLQSNKANIPFNIPKVVFDAVNRAGMKLTLFARKHKWNSSQFAESKLVVEECFQISPINCAIKSPCAAVSLDAGDFICPIPYLGSISPFPRRSVMSLSIFLVMTLSSLPVFFNEAWVILFNCMVSLHSLSVPAFLAYITPPLLSLLELSNLLVSATLFACFCVHDRSIKLYVAVSNQKRKKHSIHQNNIEKIL